MIWLPIALDGRPPNRPAASELDPRRFDGHPIAFPCPRLRGVSECHLPSENPVVYQCERRLRGASPDSPHDAPSGALNGCVLHVDGSVRISDAQISSAHGLDYRVRVDGLCDGSPTSLARAVPAQADAARQIGR